MKFPHFLAFIKRFDWRIAAAGAILTAFGLATMYSIGIHDEPANIEKFTKQFVFFGVGLLIFFIVASIDFRFLQNNAWLLYAVGIVLLSAVLFFGTTIRGTRGWLNIGIGVFQTVELAKIILIIVLAFWCDHYAHKLDKLRYLIASGLITGIYVVFVLLQPDLGSAMVFVGMWIVMLFMIETKSRYRIGVLLLAIILLVIGWFFLEDYQQERIMTFINPSQDPLGQGYHVTQSIIAVGSGQLIGRGLGLGPQSQLNFLPEQETDFIFGVISEELGLIGAGILLLSYGFLLYRIWWQAKNTPYRFGMYVLILGLGQFFIQMFVNIGMNIGIMPITGIPLPFISSGGSSLLSSWLLLGIFQSIISRKST